MQWDSPWSFDELVNIVLANPTEQPPKLSPMIFMTASEEEIEKANGRHLCTSASRFLAEYQEELPQKQFFDLATDPSFAKRTELVSGSLMTLTTNTKIWPQPKLLKIKPSISQLVPLLEHMSLL